MEKISFVWTIVFGLVIGVGANILTPYVRELLGKFSTSVKHRNEVKRRVFTQSVSYLIDHPFDEVSLRTEKNGRYTRSTIFMLASIVFATRSTGPLEMIMSTAFLMSGIYYFAIGRKYARLVSTAWLLRKPDDPEIDLG